MRYKSGGSESFDSMLFYLKNLELCFWPMGDADFHLLLDGVDGWMDDSLKVPSAIGESLFTIFASLTYAYHYLMMLIK